MVMNMKRFAIKEYGAAAEVFTEITAEPREMSPKHVRVELKAFGINPYDVSLRQGKMQEIRPVKFPYVLGNDGAGTITAVGDEVEDIRLGDDVIVHAVGGTYGEEIVVPGKKIVVKPDNMPWDQAAGIPTIGITAYHVLFSLLKIQSEQTIMILGASGGVGSVLLQLAKQNGNTVFASASSRNEAWVRSLGADDFIAYDKEINEYSFNGAADIVIDASKGSSAYKFGYQAVKPDGAYVVLNDLPPEEYRKAGVEYFHYGPKKEYQDAEAFDRLVKAYKADALNIQIADVFPFNLSSVIKAHELLEGHPPAGKIILKKNGI